MKKTKLCIFLTALILVFISLPALAKEPTGQKVVCSYSDADKSLTMNIYISSGDAIVGYCSFDYDEDVLVLANSDLTPISSVIPDTDANGNIYLKRIVNASGGIMITDVGKQTSKLINTKDGYVLFAWYLPDSTKYVDASDGDVLIAQIKFLLADGKTYLDIKNGTVKLAGSDITSNIGNWYEGILVMNSEHKQYSTSNATMTVPITYEFDFSATGGSSGSSESTTTDNNKPEDSNSDKNTSDTSETVEDTENTSGDNTATGSKEENEPDESKTEGSENTQAPDYTGNIDESETQIKNADFGISSKASENSVRIRWSTPEDLGEVLGYEITVSDTYGNVINAVSDISPITNSYTVRDIGGGFELEIVLKAYFADGFSTQSDAVKLSTLPISSDTSVISFNVEYVAENAFIYGFTDEKVMFGKTPVKSPEVIPTGKKAFSGWSIDGKTPVDISNLRIYSDVTLYALFDNETGAYIQGYDDGTFRPEGFITRAEMAALAARISGVYDKNQTYTLSFGDCTASDWFYSYVGCCTAYGLINGYQDNTFRPGNNVTRAEFAAIIARIYGFESVSGTNAFSDTQNHWAKDYISALYDCGVASPDKDGNYKPNDNLTRLDAVIMLNAAQRISADIAAIDKYISIHGNPFSDISKSDPYYYEVLSAVLGI